MQKIIYYNSFQIRGYPSVRIAKERIAADGKLVL
jgi:hypothetical protein